MRVPLVAVVGRPNVGKSTLVNRLAGGRNAIVHPEAGVTRDRNYVSTEWGGRRFETIDTGGLEPSSKQEISRGVARQVDMAAREADLILLVVDAKEGLLPSDGESAQSVRRAGKPVLLVANKVDEPADVVSPAVFGALGLGDAMAVSAAQGIGIGELLDEIVARLPEEPDGPPAPAGGTAVAIVGRPNVGKSSLVNRLASEERVLVSEQPGTTRDAVDIVITRDDKRYRLVDTAGLRRRAARGEALEYYSLLRTMRALDRAEVAVVMVDSSDEVTEQDQRIAEMAVSHRCAIVVALNKWDLVKGDQHRQDRLAAEVARKLRFVAYAPVVKISALTGQGMDGLLEVIDRVHQVYKSSVSTAKLNSFLQSEALGESGVMVGGRRLKASYVTQTGTAPPVFTFFANRPDLAKEQLRRELTNSLRRAFGFEGVPVEVRFRKK